MKNVQISLDLFLDLCDFVSDYVGKDTRADELDSQLTEKLNKLIDHALFTQYKRAATPEEREKARQAYLDRRRISKSFRTEKEVHGI